MGANLTDRVADAGLADSGSDTGLDKAIVTWAKAQQMKPGEAGTLCLPFQLDRH